MVFYVITLILMLLIWIGVCLYLALSKNRFILEKTLIVNIVCASLVFIFHIMTMIIVYRSVGFDDWNFQNTMPYANVSPLMFTICPLYFVLPKKSKVYFANLIALLSIGMIISPTASIIGYLVRNYKFHAHFLFDFGAHLILSLWGVYIIQSKQASLEVKESLIGGSIIVTIAVIMLTLNMILDQSFFGLSLNGKHSIYNMVLVSNSYLSALIFFIGLIGAMVLGYFFNKLLVFVNRKYSKVTE